MMIKLMTHDSHMSQASYDRYPLNIYCSKSIIGETPIHSSLNLVLDYANVVVSSRCHLI